MRPVPLPEKVRAAPWVMETKVIGRGDLTDTRVRPVEVARYWSTPWGHAEDDPLPTTGIVIALEPEDLERIAAGDNLLLLAVQGNEIPVFSMEMLSRFLEVNGHD